MRAQPMRAPSRPPPTPFTTGAPPPSALSAAQAVDATQVAQRPPWAPSPAPLSSEALPATAERSRPTDGAVTSVDRQRREAEERRQLAEGLRGTIPPMPTRRASTYQVRVSDVPSLGWALAHSGTDAEVLMEF